MINIMKKLLLLGSSLKQNWRVVAAKWEPVNVLSVRGLGLVENPPTAGV
jgi:hypothetical protein